MGKALEEYGEFIKKRTKMENSKEIARNFLATGDIPIELIAKNTGLTVEEIKEIIKDEDNETSFNPVKIILYTDVLNNVIAGSIYEEENETIKDAF